MQNAMRAGGHYKGWKSQLKMPDGEAGGQHDHCKILILDEGDKLLSQDFKGTPGKVIRYVKMSRGSLKKNR